MTALLRYSLRARREDIFYISWTIDAYEGVGFLSTDNPDSGLVSVYCSSDYRDELESLFSALDLEGIPVERLSVDAEV
ncbi:MAG: DUF4911 domain-containing protein [Synergistaceae bacterium]|jgi:hypothetical protein|nr:DUF4911 domain-containing protein [Synergistaceae bacterium]